MRTDNNKSGQIAMIALLVMVVILTVGLSVISQTVSDISISEDEKESIRAFSAAEAGIEKVLWQPNLSNYSDTIDGTEVKVEVAEISEGFAQRLDKGETMSVSLDGQFDASDEMTIQWTDTTKPEETDNYASLLIEIYDSNDDVRRLAWSPENNQDRNENFTVVSTQPVSTYHRQATIGPNYFTSTDQLVRIKALKDEATVEISVNNPDKLPKQAFNLTATAVAGRDKSSRIVVKKTVPVMLPIFDYVLFSKGNISKD